ncbi:U2 small nuclear ribonucleoprotein auxiliary factor 35 kDa subunit-related protein 2-like [Halichondria panicea]|uniref:U2 small nuclear ribonucleoprotein auxiliary factor 35 kDa subunit-related protein 2-like n=1 Tax=Halichondria panicea TaxID=6063 RepID=UPI00312BB094
MALNMPPDEWRSFSHKRRRQLINKERRRRKRVTEALQREQKQAVLEQDPDYLEELCAEERKVAEGERQRALQEEQWRETERVAQEEFRRKREAQEKVLREREERERLIREEWESLQSRERDEEERQERARRDKEERLQEALKTGETPLHQTSWASPRWTPESSTPPSSPPTQATPSPRPSQNPNYGTEQDPQYCSFYLKTGACRFKERCSRQHPRPSSSTTLMLPGMYTSLGFMEQLVDDKDQDTGLEYDEGELYEQFIVFYNDVLPEFRMAGKVVQFKVSCNYEPHLRGNVYVQFSTEEECSKAFQLFNGRWYAQRQLSCEYCPVQKWRSAICGLFNMKKCFKGKHCNFLHVFKNPDRDFYRADRDLPLTSPPSSHSHRRHSSHTPSHSSPYTPRQSSRQDVSRSSSRSHWSRSRKSSSDSPPTERRHSQHSRPPPSRLRRSRSRSSERSYYRRYPSSERHSTRRRRSRSSSGDKSSGDSDSTHRRSQHLKRHHKSKKKKKKSCSKMASLSRSTEASPSRESSRHKKKHRRKRRHSNDSVEDNQSLIDIPGNEEIKESNAPPPLIDDVTTPSALVELSTTPSLCKTVVGVAEQPGDDSTNQSVTRDYEDKTETETVSSNDAKIEV